MAAVPKFLLSGLTAAHAVVYHIPRSISDDGPVHERLESAFRRGQGDKDNIDGLAKQHRQAAAQIEKACATKTDYETVNHAQYRLDPALVKLFRPPGTPCRYNNKPGLFSGFANAAVLARVPVFPLDPFREAQMKSRAATAR